MVSLPAPAASVRMIRVSRFRSASRMVVSAALAMFLTAACQRGDRSKPVAGLSTAEAADSVAAPDSLRARNDAPSGKQKSQNFVDRILHRGEKKKEEKKKEEPVPVEIATVEIRDLPGYLSSTSTLEAENRAELVAKAAGEVRSLRVEEGDWVREGQVLLELDGDAQQVALEEMTARAHKLKADLERAEALKARELASAKDLADVRLIYEQAEAARKSAELQYQYTRVTAPFTGRIVRRTVDRGQNVSPGTPLFTLVDPDPLLANIYLPEKDAMRLRVGEEIRVSPDAHADRDYLGAILRISPIVDERTGTVKVTCRVNGPAPDQERSDDATPTPEGTGEPVRIGDRPTEDAPLRPGSFVRVKLLTGIRKDAHLLAKRALVPEGGENYVFKVTADSVRKVGVLLGGADDRSVEILAGLDPGDQVVSVGQGALKNGAKIRILPPKNEAAE